MMGCFTTAIASLVLFGPLSYGVVGAVNVTCEGHFDPLCGSDLRTYKSYCHMTMAFMWKAARLPKILARGWCADQLDRNIAYCGPEESPVCDDLLNTHKNKCEYHKYYRFKREPEPGIAYIGWCEEDVIDTIGQCRQCCSKKHDIVCGKDGNTYQNECMMLKAFCRNAVQVPQVAHAGPCMDKEIPQRCPRVCYRNWDPVCDRNGHFHSCKSPTIRASNQCMYDRVYCTGHPPGIAHKGRCRHREEWCGPD